jgi:tRNA U54 and U55 pseudouridine synthase Pus10
MIKIHGHTYITARQFAAVRYGVSPEEAGQAVRKIYHLLDGGEVEGAIKAHKAWFVPIETARHEVKQAEQLAQAMRGVLAELEGEVTE